MRSAADLQHPARSLVRYSPIRGSLSAARVDREIGARPHDDLAD